MSAFYVVILSLSLTVTVVCNAADIAPGQNTKPDCPDCKSDTNKILDLASLITETPWLAPEQRQVKFAEDFMFKNQQGKAISAKDLRGKPLIITFLYTRCTNELKCPLAAKTFAQLQERFNSLDLLKEVRLAIITYDPEFDSPDVLKEYAKAKGLKCDTNVMMLRPEPEKKNALFNALELPVNFSSINRVNVHGVTLLMLDAEGRLAKSYKTTIWNNEKVELDVRRLIAEKVNDIKGSNDAP